MNKVKVALIRTDGGTQPRVVMSTNTVDEYALDMESGAVFPPVTLFYDGKDYWLSDGFHRISAARKAGLDTIDADVTEGTKRDAILYSVGCNGKHGQRRTNKDKQKAVEKMLNDKEWVTWSDREIARRCNVSAPFVSGLRPVTVNNYSEKPAEKTYTTKHGTTSTMKTENIGKQSTVEPELFPDEEPEEDEVEVPQYTIDDSEAPTQSIIKYIDITLKHITVQEVKHEVVNNILKYVRNLSVEMNRNG